MSGVPTIRRECRAMRQAPELRRETISGEQAEISDDRGGVKVMANNRKAISAATGCPAMASMTARAVCSNGSARSVKRHLY